MLTEEMTATAANDQRPLFIGTHHREMMEYKYRKNRPPTDDQPVGRHGERMTVSCDEARMARIPGRLDAFP